MSGHFVLNRISTQDLQTLTSVFGTLYSLTRLEHAGGTATPAGRGVFPGWTADSRRLLQTGLQGGDVGQRENLPPHRYIQFSVMPRLEPAHAEYQLLQKRMDYLRAAPWVDALVRPGHASFRATALCPEASAAWEQGRKSEALISQWKHGDVSIELYHIDHDEIG